MPRPVLGHRLTGLLIVTVVAATGCGTIKSRIATEQLLVSQAVDQSIDGIDFSPLADKTCFLDTRYLRNVVGIGFVNADYIISSLRQRMVAARCLIQDTADSADYIVEPRVGVLGADAHEVNYGIPSSQPISSASSIIGSGGAMPVLPEVSLAKKEERRASVKIAIFAFHRETREPIWESRTVRGESVAKSTWVLGAGPFEEGTIYESAQFAGKLIEVPKIDLPKLPTESIQPKEFAAWLTTSWSKLVGGPDASTLSPHAPLSVIHASATEDVEVENHVPAVRQAEEKREDVDEESTADLAEPGAGEGQPPADESTADEPISEQTNDNLSESEPDADAKSAAAADAKPAAATAAEPAAESDGEAADPPADASP